MTIKANFKIDDEFFLLSRSELKSNNKTKNCNNVVLKIKNYF